MSPEVDAPIPPAAAPVFVDDTGSRLARTRIMVRVLIGALVSYAVLVGVGLAGSASLPVVHFGNLGRLPTRSGASPRLGAHSSVVPFPAALSRHGTDRGAGTPARSQPAASAGPVSPNTDRQGSTSGTAPAASGSGATSPGHGGTTTIASTTTAPSSTTTTNAHGRGPPSSAPRGPSGGRGPRAK